MGLARQIALPHEYAPERFPSFPALERTAVMGFCQPTTLALGSSTPVKVMLARQACYPLWGDQIFSTAWSYQVTYGLTNAPAGSATSRSQSVSQLNNWSVGPATASTVNAGVAGGTSLSPYPYLGVDNSPIPFIWVPPGAHAILSVIRSNTTGTTNVYVTLQSWASPGEFTSSEVPLTIFPSFASAHYDYGPSIGVWLRPTLLSEQLDATANLSINYLNVVVTSGTSVITDNATNFPSMSVAASALPAFTPLSSPAEFLNSKLPWYATRTTAASALFSNVSQVLNKAGTVLGGRVSPNVINPFTVDSTYVNTLHPAEKAWLPLETGMYTYCPPSTDLANFWDYTSVSVSSISVPLYRLDNDALVNVAFFTAGSVAETLAITLDWHIEFRTSSALFQIGLSTLPLEVLHQAQLSLTAAGFFFENPEHKSVLQKVVSAVKRFAPTLMSVANTAFPQYMRAINVAKTLFPQPAAMKMQPTSGSKSGIVVQKKKVTVSRPRKGKGKTQKGKK